MMIVAPLAGEVFTFLIKFGLFRATCGRGFYLSSFPLPLLINVKPFGWVTLFVLYISISPLTWAYFVEYKLKLTKSFPSSEENRMAMYRVKKIDGI
ncbi:MULTISPECIES: hypothetical protein [unclassified Nostoc]|uniref:hypothetical protein n=1 Tax=unclassified Nostoc TaxID=2593658 RepID=UPI0013D3F802|nr:MULTISPECIES: hypothetical protein [unclassified Nostoc]MBE9002818.1 hypothetical protein [Nostoc sp. LEGE 12447]NEU78315.1 hypothetical protein [Nostoc sp. UIC 10630]